MSPAAVARKPVFADSGNRAVAFLLDVTVLVFILGVLSSVLPREILHAGANAFLAILYFGALPITPMQGTPGKWMMRIKLCDRSGARLGWGRSLLRAGAMVAWLWLAAQLPQLTPESGAVEYLMLAGWIAFFLAWAPLTFTPRAQTLFDLLAGTLVVRRDAAAGEIAAAEPRKHSKVEIGVAILTCLMLGAFVDTAMYLAHVRNLRARVGYAVEATGPLRDKVKDFHSREGRWPRAAELGVPDFTPYRDGGGYRLGRDGVVVIGFSVLPELKGRTVTLRPTPLADGSGGLDWKCTADPDLPKRYLRGACR